MSSSPTQAVRTVAATWQQFLFKPQLLLLVLSLLSSHLTAETVTTNRSLHVRSIPPVYGYSSSLYEVFMQPYSFSSPPISARVLLRGGKSEAEGELVLRQATPPYGAVEVTGNASGLPPGLHRVYVSTAGDLQRGCGPALSQRYSPYQVSAAGGGGVEADLGGVLVSEDGSATVRLLVPVISLSSPRSVAGRGLVLQKDADPDAAICGTIAYSRPDLPHEELSAEEEELVA